MEVQAWIRLTFEELGTEKAFNLQARQMGFSCLEDILMLPPAELFERTGFTYLWLEKLTAILIEKELLHLLQATPGKSAY